MSKVYSSDGEGFDYECLKTLIADCDLKDGDIVFEGEASPIDAGKLFDADDLIEYVGERMYDQVGECAEGWPFVTPEQQEEINKELKVLLSKHFNHSFYRVLNVKEYKITKEDVE